MKSLRITPIDELIIKQAEVYAGLNADGEMDSARYFSFIEGATFALTTVRDRQKQYNKIISTLNSI